MDKVIIGLYGASVFNYNLGCQALTYSLLNALEDISKNLKVEFEYHLFERFTNEKKVDEVSETLSIERSRIKSVHSAQFLRPYKIAEIKQCIDEIRKCQVVIDLTAGDSFADIYGVKRFFTYTSEKLVVEHNKVPLILGPQTYGPFKHKIVRVFAKRAIDKSFYIFSRDPHSEQHLRELGIKKEIYTGTDLAFSLPYKPFAHNGSLNAGINISGMLWNRDISESGVQFDFKCDYKKLCIDVINLLLNRGYNVHLIPHVERDCSAIESLAKQNLNLIYPSFFGSPVEAKNYISGLDFFVGARMHATIGAVSSGVPTIPISYSIKFQGLFAGLDYNYMVDLKTEDNKSAVQYISNCLDEIQIMKAAVNKSKDKAQNEFQCMKGQLERVVCSALNMK